MTNDRQQQKHQESRKLILDAAKEIISNEGVQGVSIRKITRTLGYSPAIVYHYFKDKNEIIETVMAEGFGKIIETIQGVARNEFRPDEEIKEVFLAYIRATLKYPHEFKAFVLSENPDILEKMKVLSKGATEKRPTLRALKGNIERGISLGIYKCQDPELTAQVIWTSIMGLLIRLVIEKNTPEEQVDRLVEHQFEVLFNGLLYKEKEIKNEVAK